SRRVPNSFPFSSSFRMASAARNLLLTILLVPRCPRFAPRFWALTWAILYEPIDLSFRDIDASKGIRTCAFVICLRGERVCHSQFGYDTLPPTESAAACSQNSSRRFGPGTGDARRWPAS